ncbi:MAG: S41 family peptidase [Saprospiraceae bacterium]|nr:S41 family peptidase [Saprospiraceae bacterium]
MQPLNHSRYEIWQPLILALVLAGGMLLGTRLDDELPNMMKMPSYQSADEPWDELKRVVGFIESRYGDSLDVDSISHEVIKLLVSNLDPHSYYLSGMDYLNFKERMNGSYIGIGIDYNIIRDTMRLIKVVGDSPAERSGLKQGDCVLAINEDLVSGVGLNQKDAYLIWKKTEKTIRLKLLTASSAEEKSLEIEKGPVNLPSVPAGLLVKGEIGYIKITRFASDTYKEFMDHLEKLVTEGMQDLIIDVRENPGGSLDQVIKILNQLVSEREQLLLYTEGLNTKRVEYKSTGKPFFNIGKIAVLIDENSVSASEVLAGSLQDLDRAIIVGRRSFGKGLVQEMYNLTPESAINLTVAKYYLPSGRSIQKSYLDRRAYDQDLDYRIESGELFEPDSTIYSSTAPDSVVKSSGEGIIPDIFVAADSFYFSDAWKSHEHQYYSDAFDFYMTHQEAMKEIIESGESLTVFEKEIFKRLAFAEVLNTKNLTREKILEGYLHLIKWHYYGEPHFFEKMTDDDEEIQTAIKALEDPEN